MTLPVSQDLLYSCSILHSDLIYLFIYLGAAHWAAPLKHESSSGSVWSLRGLILDVPEWDICSVCSCLLWGRDLVWGLRFTSRIMNALFVCPYFQLAPLKVNRKVKEMSHCEYKCHSAQKKWKKKKCPSQVFQWVPNSSVSLYFWGVTRVNLRSAEVVRHPRVSKRLGFGNCSC